MCVRAAAAAGTPSPPPETRQALGSFLTNRGLLLAAWFVVMAFLGGVLTLAFLQPPPPPTAEPFVLAVDLSPPAEEAAPGEMTPEGPAPDDMVPEETAPEDMAPEDMAEEDLAPEDLAEQEMPAQEPAAAAEGESGPAEAADHEAAPETGQETGHETAETPAEGEETHGAAPELPPEEAAAPEAAASVSAPLPEAEPQSETAEAPMPEEHPAEEHAPAEAAQGTEPQAAQAHSGESQTEESQGGEAPAGDGHGAGGEQMVNIPVIPPAPEQLPYWERYRQPFNMDDKRPRIAVVLSGLGLSDSATEAAINKLPSAVTLSFSPYTRGLERWIALARSRGHEVMIDLPMEPATFPNEDPGPQALLTSLSAEDNLDRLDWVLSRGSAYVGVAGAMGSRFTASRSAMEPILRDVKSRGLIFLDRRTTENSVVPELAREIGLPRAVNNRSVDERQASRVAIDARLAQIERIALTDGYAVAMAQPYPVTLDRLADWATELTARGFVIAPISALANQQTLP